MNAIPMETAESASALETCLLAVNTTYQRLLEQPGAIDQCREAGRTLRRLAQCITDAELCGLDDDDLEEDSDDELNG